MSASRSRRARRRMTSVAPYNEGAVFRRNDYTCSYCGIHVVAGRAGYKPNNAHRQATVDHVVPIFLGGDDMAHNVTTACSDCNSDKGSDTAMVDIRILLFNLTHPLHWYPNPRPDVIARQNAKRAAKLAVKEAAEAKRREMYKRQQIDPPNLAALPPYKEYWTFVVMENEGLNPSISYFHYAIPLHSDAAAAWKKARLYMSATGDKRVMLRCYPWREQEQWNKV